MRIADYPMVEALVATRNHLIELRDEGRIRIDINGRAMDSVFVEEVRPAAKLVLRHRIEAVEAQLGELGVVIEPTVA